MRARGRLTSSIAAFATLITACGSQSSNRDLPVETLGAFSAPMTIDRIYKSMAGPAEIMDFSFGDGPPELLWITAYRTEVTGRQGEDISQEFMCHNNLDFIPEFHKQAFSWNKNARWNRMFTASQGQFEVVLPDGFGIPILSNEPLRVGTQVLNHNREDVDLEVRHRITIEFVRDEAARGSLRPLYPTLAYVIASLGEDEQVYSTSQPTHAQEGASCLPGAHAPHAGDAGRVSDSLGRSFTGHWVVPPGREVRRTLVTELLDLPFDTTVHYIASHLHPFAESLELRDLTTGESVYRTRATAPASGIGLADVEIYSSVEGIPLYSDHDYEMVSVYNNTSGLDQDAMATFFLYLADREADVGLEKLRVALEHAGVPSGS